MGVVLVTGGTGFLGRHLVRALVDRGEKVRVLVRPGSTQPDSPAFRRCEIVPGDVRDPDAVGRAVVGTEIVIHLVSNFRRAGSDDAQAQDVNVKGTEHLLEASAAHGVRQFVHCSTIGVHGDVRQIPAHEDSPFNPGDLYQRTKVAAEGRVLEVSRSSGLPITIVRPVSMYGPGDRRMLKLFRMIQRGWFLRAGAGEVHFQAAYVEDVVQGFLLCMRNPGAMGETFVVGGEEPVTLNELARVVADVLGVSFRTVSVPLPPLVLLAHAVEALCGRLGVEPPLHRRRLSFYQNNRVFTVRKARERLGYAPAFPLRDGLQRTVSWYRSHGWL